MFINFYRMNSKMSELSPDKYPRPEAAPVPLHPIDLYLRHVAMSIRPYCPERDIAITKK